MYQGKVFQMSLPNHSQTHDGAYSLLANALHVPDRQQESRAEGLEGPAPKGMTAQAEHIPSALWCHMARRVAL